MSLDGVMPGPGRVDEDRRRLFPEGVQVSLRLTDSVTTSTGVVIVSYQREGG